MVSLVVSCRGRGSSRGGGRRRRWPLDLPFWWKTYYSRPFYVFLDVGLWRFCSVGDIPIRLYRLGGESCISAAMNTSTVFPNHTQNNKHIINSTCCYIASVPWDPKSENVHAFKGYYTIYSWSFVGWRVCFTFFAFGILKIDNFTLTFDCFKNSLNPKMN